MRQKNYYTIDGESVTADEICERTGYSKGGIYKVLAQRSLGNNLTWASFGVKDAPEDPATESTLNAAFRAWGLPMPPNA